MRPPGEVTAVQSGLNVIELPPTMTSRSPVIPVDQSSVTAQSAQGFVPFSD